MLLSIFVALAFFVASNAHSVTVRGYFICGRNASLPVFAELMESDAFGDDRLNWLNTVVFKAFQIKGSEEERFGITPYLRVTHSCRGFEETSIIPFGHRKGDVIINVGDVVLDSYEDMAALRHRFAW
ncbi:hypothetical protein Aduo_017613 [Ancylostoma duodenale]